MRFQTIISAAALYLAIGSSSYATLIAYDGFETYPSDVPLGDTTGGATGDTWTSNWTSLDTVKVVTPSTSLTYSKGSITLDGGSQAVEINTSGNTDNIASRRFEAQTETVYFSFLFRVESGLAFDDDDFIQFALNNDTSIANSASIGDLSNAAGADTFGARIGGSNGGATNQSDTSIVQGTTYFLVGKISKTGSSGDNYNQIELFVDPSSLDGSGVVASTIKGGSAGIDTLSYFTLRVADLNSTDQYQFDELRIGTTWGDVMPIPEPAMWGWVAGGIVFWATFARRRSA